MYSNIRALNRFDQHPEKDYFMHYSHCPAMAIIYIHAFLSVEP